MRHHGKERVMVMMVMIAELLTLLRFEMVLGQQQPCSTSDNGTPQGCCPCQTGSSDVVGAWLLCERTCPSRYYVNNDTSACAPPSTPPASTTTTNNNNTNTTEQAGGISTLETTTLSTNSTIDLNITTTTTTTSATPTPLLVLCIPCHVTCQSCNGSDVEDCLACANEYEFQTTNGAKTCVRIQKDESPGANVGVIVGATVGGVVLIVVVVVAVVVWCRRRRQNMEPKHTRSISTLMGSGVPTATVNNADDVEKEERETTPSSKVSSVKEVTYGNIQSSTLNTESIQQGHDKVLRYTRDPTVKANTKVTTTAAEEKELQDLPVAPAPPRQTPTAQPPQDHYEIVESPTAKSKPNPSPQTQTPAPAQAYEIMEMPKNSALRPKTSGPHPTRSQTTLLKPGEKNRKTAGVASTLPTPYPASPVSCPELPRFPKEQEEQSRSGRQQAAKSHRRVPPPPPMHEEPDTLDPEDDYVNVGEKPKDNAQDQESAASDPEDNYENSGASKKLFAQLKAGKKAQKEEQTTASDPEDDYENSGASKKLSAQLKARKNAQKEEQAGASDPEDDYENSGTKRKLVPGNNRDQSQGLVNPAADLLEEPEKIYGNQEAFEEQEPQPRYSNTPLPPQEIVESSKKSSDGAGDQDSDDDQAYQNVPSRRSKP